MPRSSAKSLREAQFRLIELTGVRVFSLTPEPPYRFVDVSQAEQSNGLPCVPSAGSLADLIASDHLEAASACIAQALGHRGTLCETELRMVESSATGNGWVRFHALASEHANALVVHGALLPLDGQKRAEALAEERRKEFERALLRMAETQRFLEGLQHTTELLHLSEREADGYSVVVQAGRALMPNWQGAVTAAGPGGEMSVVAHWGGEPGLEPPEVQGAEADCWALRLGRLYHVGVHGARRDAGPLCSHFGFGDSLPPGVTNAICVPFQVAPGRAGALHLLAREPIAEEELHAALWRAQPFADTLRLSLTNLHLRVSLREQAERDALTGLFNRRYFDDVLAREISRAQRSGHPLTLAIFDIDYFKSFNDAFGHEAGDEVIRTVARQLLAFVRSYDVACRIGGEELALLMPDAQLNNACARLDRLREQIAGQRTHHQGVELPAITVSVGVASLDGGDVSDLLRRADLALYASKNGGRNRLSCWTPELDSMEARPRNPETSNHRSSGPITQNGRAAPPPGEGQRAVSAWAGD